MSLAEISLTDASGFPGHADRVLAPASEADLRAILVEANSNRIPVTILGSRTGITGGSMPRNGWAVSMEKFRRIEIFPGHAIAGAAVTLSDLQAAASPTNQFYAPDPTEWTASVGGTVNTNASGSRSFRFGSTRRHILGLRVLLMDGRLIECRRGDAIDFPVPALPCPSTTKTTAGYPLQPGMDWIDLFCGSEGTLGVVVEADLLLLPNPPLLLAGVVFFPSLDNALDAVDAWRSAPNLRMIEFVDRRSLELVRSRYPEIPLDAQAALLIESEEDAGVWVDRLESSHALIEASWFGETARDRERFRVFRHALPEAVNETVIRRGFMKLGSDFAVPIARCREMTEYYLETLRDIWPGEYVLYGHIGDAHLHVNLMPATEEEDHIGHDMMAAFARHAVSLGGTVSAEHGLGKRKSHFLPLQFTRSEIEAMKTVKRRLDPHWLLGQGNLFPEA